MAYFGRLTHSLRSIEHSYRTPNMEIEGALHGVPFTALDIPPYEKRLAPLTASLWKTASSELSAMYEQYRLVHGQDLNFMAPNRFSFIKKIWNEADTSTWLVNRLVNPLIEFFCSTKEAVQRGVPINLDPEFLQAFQNAAEFSPQAQRKRFPFEQDGFDNVGVSSDFGDNREQHDLDQQERHSDSRSGPRSSPADTLREAKSFFLEPKADLVLVWYGRTVETSGLGGLPFLPIEVKSPNKLTRDLLMGVMLEFNKYVRVDEVKQLFLQGGTIDVCVNLFHELCPLEPEAKAVLAVVVQQYHTMVNLRQTYGLITSGLVSMAIKIDWQHAIEPGQHIFYAIHDGSNNTLTPEWRDEHIPIKDLFHLSAALAGLQLKTGFVDQSTVDDLIVALYDKQDSVQETTQEQEARREASTTSERRASARIAARQQHALDVNSAKLNLVKTDRCRKELERLLTFHDKIRAMPFEPEQLFSLLCAAYPYDPTNSRVSTRISHESATDTHLFQPWRLDEGVVPKGFNNRLAWASNPRMAQIIRDEMQRQASQSGSESSLDTESDPDLSPSIHQDKPTAGYPELDWPTHTLQGL